MKNKQLKDSQGENNYKEKAIKPEVKTKKKKDKKRFKLFSKDTLLKLFFVEHLVFLLFILFVTFSYVRANTYSPFSGLNDAARSFQKVDNQELFDDLGNQLKQQVPMENIQDIFNMTDLNIEIFVKEKYINSFVYDIDVSPLEQIYFDFCDDNIVLIWIKLEDFDYPLMARYRYSYVDGQFVLEPLNVQLSIIPLPEKWTFFINDMAEESIAELIDKYEGIYHFELENIISDEGGVTLNFYIEDVLNIFNEY